MNEEFQKLKHEETKQRDTCDFCKESRLSVGQKTGYGAVIIYRTGKSDEESWFATLSPKTGGDPEKDFTIQLMPARHLTHFAQMNSLPELARNYGVAFAKITEAMTAVMAEKGFEATSPSRESAVSIATYGKCTTWKEKKEHLHVKIFPFRGDIGQPYTVDSTFGKKEIFKDQKTGEEYVKMLPVRKKLIPKERFEQLAASLISLLK